MTQIRHVCTAKGPQCPAPLKRTVPPGIGAEDSTTRGRGGEVRGINYAQWILDPPIPHLLLQVPWESPVGSGQQLAGSSTQPQEITAEVGESDKGVGERGSVWPDFGNILCGSCSVSLAIWVGDVGYVPMYWEEFGRILPQGGPQTERRETVEGTRWEVGVSTTSRGDARGGITVGGYIHLPPQEHSCTVHRDQAHYGLVSGDGETPRDKGFIVVMGVGGLWLGGDADVGSGGGMGWKEGEGGRGGEGDGGLDGMIL